MENCTRVTYMLLLSYAGLPIYSHKLHIPRSGRIIYLETEAYRTMQQLEADVLHEQGGQKNGYFARCSETGRVMKIDFDQALIVQAR